MRTATRSVDGVEGGSTSVGCSKLFGTEDAGAVVRGETTGNGRVEEASTAWRRVRKRDLRRAVRGVEGKVRCGIGKALGSFGGCTYVAEKGMMASQSTSSFFAYPCPLAVTFSL